MLGAAFMPHQVLFVDDRYVALGFERNPQIDDRGLARFVVATSEDGTEWERSGDDFVIEATGAAIAHHEGLFTIVASSPAERESGTTLTTFTSADLDEWASRTESIIPESLDTGYIAAVWELVVNDRGALVSLGLGPPYFDPAPLFRELGHVPEDVCVWTVDVTYLEFRACGTDKKVRVELEDPYPPPNGFDSALYFAPPRGVFAPVSLPWPDGVRPSGAPSSLYKTDEGFGVTGSPTFESPDGTAWTAIETRGDDGPMMAARGNERVYRTMWTVQRFNGDDPEWGAGYRDGDGDWQPSEMDSLVFEDSSHMVYYSGLQAGPAGWAVVAARNDLGATPVEGVEREAGGPSDFTIEADGYVLSGHTPFGPARLVDETGALVRDWEWLEVMNPTWSGFTVLPGAVSLEDPETGEVIVTFTHRQWQAVHYPRSDLREASLLFSSNGREWDLIATRGEHLEVLAIGDDELLVREFFSIGQSWPNSVIFTLPLGPDS